MGQMRNESINIAGVNFWSSYSSQIHQLSKFYIWPTFIGIRNTWLDRMLNVEIRFVAAPLPVTLSTPQPRLDTGEIIVPVIYPGI